jgi:hypothetical protein
MIFGVLKPLKIHCHFTVTIEALMNKTNHITGTPGNPVRCFAEVT